MAVTQRRLSIREENDYFELNRGIIPPEQPAAPISFQVTPPNISDADSLQGKDWASPDPIGSSVAAEGTFAPLNSTALVAASTSLSVSAGSIDGVPIGSSAKSSAAFTRLTSTAAALTSTGMSISGGSIDGTQIGSSAPALGKFNQLIVPSTVPATSSSTGVAGEFAFSTAFFYGCISADRWARTALSTW